MYLYKHPYYTLDTSGMFTKKICKISSVRFSPSLSILQSVLEVDNR